MNLETRKVLMGGVVESLKANHPLAVRLTAARSFGIACAILPKEQAAPYASLSLEHLCNILPSTSDDTLHLTLDSLGVTLRLDPNSSAKAESQITPFILKVWSAHTEDPLITSSIKEVLEALCATPASLQSVQQHTVPTLAGILKSTEAKSVVTVAALDILQMFLLKPQPSGIPDTYFSNILPLILQSALLTDDDAVLVEACNVIAQYVRLASEKISSLTFNGENAVSIILKVMAKLLSPQMSSTGASNVGDIVTQVLCKFGQNLSQNIPTILTAVVNRMASSKNADLRQSLLLVFARLVNQHGSAILDALKGNVAMDGQNISMIEFVIKTWCESQDLFRSMYHQKIGLTALCKLVQEQTDRLMTIGVQGDPIVDTNARRSSRRRPTLLKYTTIPAPVKILSILVGAWVYDKQEEVVVTASAFELGLDEVSNISSSSKRVELSNLAALADVKHADAKDPMAATDPTNKIEIQTYVQQFCLAFAKADSNRFNGLASQLSQGDQKNLQLILTQKQ